MNLSNAWNAKLEAASFFAVLNPYKQCERGNTKMGPSKHMRFLGPSKHW